mmetsp:Transcript_40953/g.101457  ORF Transcript_40953/g.101457 Transcript_40953/m.101457 type:complete len:326 (+) Transcript_40953:3-980(+)
MVARHFWVRRTRVLRQAGRQRAAGVGGNTTQLGEGVELDAEAAEVARVHLWGMQGRVDEAVSVTLYAADLVPNQEGGADGEEGPTARPLAKELGSGLIEPPAHPEQGPERGNNSLRDTSPRPRASAYVGVLGRTASGKAWGFAQADTLARAGDFDPFLGDFDPSLPLSDSLLLDSLPLNDSDHRGGECDTSRPLPDSRPLHDSLPLHDSDHRGDFDPSLLLPDSRPLPDSPIDRAARLLRKLDAGETAGLEGTRGAGSGGFGGDVQGTFGWGEVAKRPKCGRRPTAGVNWEWRRVKKKKKKKKKKLRGAQAARRCGFFNCCCLIV